MAQLLLRPSKPLRRAVEGFLARAVGFGQAFNAVHLRDFEGTCVKRCRPENIASQSVTEADLGRPVNCEDFCNMTDAYLNVSLYKGSALGRPLVLAHDGQNPARAAEIVRHYGAKVYAGPNAAFVDMLLLLQSNYLVGNPLSTFSFTAAMVRRAVLEDPATNLLEFYPGPSLKLGMDKCQRRKWYCVARPSVAAN
mmetsp:Transcript_45076/g.101760  ORF Transcript_45076/g.101760 Transcript_45076/m.101760 type:complete len:195 (-) Transcript_45076:151-735(-)